MSINNNESQEITLEQVNAILQQLGQKSKAAFKTKDYKAAQKYILRVLEIAPKQKIAWMDLATVTLRLSEYEQAYRYFQTCMQYMGNEVDTNVYDGMTEVCYWLEKYDEQLKYGRLALQSKKDLVQHEPAIEIPRHSPEAFNPKARLENIISYSLFGDSPRYGEVAILNMKHAAEIYPEWTCRFYVDDTVPVSILQRLTQKGAQIIQVNEDQKKISGLYWRFFVMDDPAVKRFLIRDADSFLSYRERAAVDAWLSSEEWFHSMRDSYTHTELILAGMWGGCTGIFKNIQGHIEAFIETGRFLNQRVMDQHYLRFCVWPTIQKSILQHDSQGYDEQAKPFPKQKNLPLHEQYEKFHVGANEASSSVKITIQHRPSRIVTWILKNELHKEICRYDVATNYEKSFSVYLPVQYAERIKRQEWYIETQIKDV